MTWLPVITATIPANGRIIQNIIHGWTPSCPTSPISITCPRWTSSTQPASRAWRRGCRPIRHPTCCLDGSAVHFGSTLVVHYVQALEMRRKMHTAGALFSGRQPIQNAMVPGGVTTLFSSTYPADTQSGTDYDQFGPFNAADYGEQVQIPADRSQDIHQHRHIFRML